MPDLDSTNDVEKAHKSYEEAKEPDLPPDAVASDLEVQGQAQHEQTVSHSHDEDEVVYPSGLRLTFLTMGIMAVVLMVALDNYILATAIPRISTQFKSLNAIGWYASSYFLTQMAIQPAFGHLFTDLPVKTVYLAAMVIFEIGSVVCATAPSSIALIVGRLVAGAGGAGLYVGTLTVVGSAVPIKQRPVYLSVVTSMFGVASVAGPLLGGGFTDSMRLTWRFCFWINLPIGIVAALLMMLSFKESEVARSRLKPSLAQTIAEMDILGVSFLIAAFVCLILALQWAGVDYKWGNPRVWGCLLGFGLLITAFLLVQVYQKHNASIPLHIVFQRTAASSSGFLLFISMIVGTLIYYLPLYFQAVKGTDATSSGIHNLPFLVTLLFAPMLSGALITAFGYYVPFMYVGSILATIGSGLLYTLQPDSSSSVLAGYQFLAGFGLGICNQIPFSAVQYILPADQMVLGSTLVSFCNSLGPVLGTNIAQAIFANIFVRRLDSEPNIDVAVVVKAPPTNLGSSASPAVRDAFNEALTKSFLLPVACGGMAFLCSLTMEWGNVKKKK